MLSLYHRPLDYPKFISKFALTLFTLQKSSLLMQL